MLSIATVNIQLGQKITFSISSYVLHALSSPHIVSHSCPSLHQFNLSCLAMAGFLFLGYEKDLSDERAFEAHIGLKAMKNSCPFPL